MAGRAKRHARPVATPAEHAAGIFLPEEEDAAAEGIIALPKRLRASEAEVMPLDSDSDFTDLDERDDEDDGAGEEGGGTETEDEAEQDPVDEQQVARNTIKAIVHQLPRPQAAGCFKVCVQPSITYLPSMRDGPELVALVSSVLEAGPQARVTDCDTLEHVFRLAEKAFPDRPLFDVPALQPGLIASGIFAGLVQAVDEAAWKKTHRSDMVSYGDLERLVPLFALQMLNPKVYTDNVMYSIASYHCGELLAHMLEDKEASGSVEINTEYKTGARAPLVTLGWARVSERKGYRLGPERAAQALNDFLGCLTIPQPWGQNFAENLYGAAMGATFAESWVNPRRIQPKGPLASRLVSHMPWNARHWLPDLFLEHVFSCHTDWQQALGLDVETPDMIRMMQDSENVMSLDEGEAWMIWMFAQVDAE